MAKNWSKIRLGDICQTNKSTYSLSEKWDYVNYLDTGNLTQDKVSDYQHIVLGQDKLPSRARRKVEVDDILYSTVRPNQLHYGIAKKLLLNTLVSTGFAVITVDKEKANSDFIYYYLTQNDVTETLQAIGEQSTSAYPSIKPSDIENLEISLPTLEEQEVIAHTLRSLDQKIEVNREINHHLAEIAKSIFDSYFIDLSPYDGVMPDDWQLSNLTGIANYLNGLAMQKHRPQSNEQGLPVLKIKELRQGFTDSTSDLCSSNIRRDYIIHDGDVIFSWSGSLLVDFWTGGDCGLNQHLFKVSSETYDKWFYYAWTKHHLDRFVKMAADRATTMGHIKRDALEKAEVLIPSNKDYQEIGNKLKPIYDQIINNRVESRKLVALRDTLLPKLMSGEISVTD